MFLRMASGLGFCQLGDYVASLFFLFRRRGHRFLAAIGYCDLTITISSSLAMAALASMREV